ncbi:hypothetical protein T4E_10882 [Trichinella pseudospiralis]|uniref:Uncharacterized protein n=1 Tax=Trichinella pseudospiralis TaxID=6337 RepID=A0A0V0Y1V3_TRIPS|nr:hypothetical protein T4E_10882 [Trichinella pseudospiralis]
MHSRFRGSTTPWMHWQVHSGSRPWTWQAATGRLRWNNQDNDDYLSASPTIFATCLHGSRSQSPLTMAKVDESFRLKGLLVKLDIGQC